MKRKLKLLLLAIGILITLSPIAVSETHAATIYAHSTSGNDTTGDGTSETPYKTFQKAYTIASANDTINLTGTFTWTDGDETGDASTSGYTLAKNLTLTGQGADQTFIQADATDDTADRRVFSITTNATISISNLAIRYGKSTGSGGGIHIENGSTLTLNNTEIYSCRTTGNGGGAIFNQGATTINNSAIYSNVDDWAGGGIASNYTGSTIVITNSTIYSNTNTGGWNGGGGVWVGDSTATVTNSTIYNNTAVSSGDGIWVYHANATLNIKNTIVTGNDTSDISKLSGTINNNGYNIVTSYSSFTPTTGDWTDTNRDGTFDLVGGGTGTLSLETTAGINDNPNKTKTFAITASGSIAKDNGENTANNGIAIPTTDQRSATRTNTDIGAFEFDGGGLTINAPTTQASNIVFSLVEYNRLTFSWTNGNGSRRAVFAKQANTGTASPADSTRYTGDSNFTDGDQIGTSGWYAIYDGLGNSVTITGLTATSDYNIQVFEYNGIGTGAATYFNNTAANNPLVQATYTPVTLYCNYTSGDDGTGDGTSGTPYKSFHKCYTSSNPGDTLNLTGTFNWSNADETGDATTDGYTLSQDLTITGQGADVTFIQADSAAQTTNRRVFDITAANVTFNNIAIRYGDVGASGGCIQGSTTSTVNFNNVEIYDCRTTAGNGGGFFNQYNSTIINSTIYNNSGSGSLSGGGIASYNATVAPNLTITNCTIHSNQYTAGWNAGGGIHVRTGNATITNSTITNNTGTNNGGIYIYDSVSTLTPVLYIKNTIVAENIGSSYKDLYGQAFSTVVNNGYNIIGEHYANASSTELNANNWTDTDDNSTFTWNNDGGTTGTINFAAEAALNSSLNGTKTFAISTGSIAINNGNTTANNTVSIPNTDQRGGGRTSTLDIGAYEFEADFTSPTISTLTPADNETEISVSANLIVVFSEAVDVESGNISVKLSSDDSTVETIDVTSDKVSGTGTTTITINPTSNLLGSTQYYITIDATAFDDAGNNSFAGISLSTTWNFTTESTGGSGGKAKQVVQSHTNSITGSSTSINEQTISRNTIPNTTSTSTSTESHVPTTSTISGNTKTNANQNNTIHTTLSTTAITNSNQTSLPTSSTLNTESNKELREVPTGITPTAIIEKKAKQLIIKEFQKKESEPHHWSQPYIEELVEREAIEDNRTQITPTEELTRGEYLRLALKTFKVPIQDFSATDLKDINNKSPYAKEIVTARKNGWITGYGDKQYKPLKKINRAETLVIAMRMIEMNQKELKLKTIFTDVSLDSWYTKSIYYAQFYNIVQGINKTQFDPDRPVTRGEAAKILLNTLYHIGENF
jgi:hypothetical protein